VFVANARPVYPCIDPWLGFYRTVLRCARILRLADARLTNGVRVVERLDELLGGGGVAVEDVAQV
jgi:hypothetical protein